MVTTDRRPQHSLTRGHRGVNTDRPSPATSDKWVERLAQALSNLAAAQEIYRDELYQRRQERVRSRREIAWSVAPEHPSDDLAAFYYQVDPSRKSGGALHRLHCFCLEFDGACEVQRRVPTDWIIEPVDVSGYGSFSLAS